MADSLLIAGIVCIVASIVGGGVKMLGAEMPVLSSFPRQALLFAVGVVFLAASFATSGTKPTPTPTPTPTSSASANVGTTNVASAPCVQTSALGCLPRSSAPVSFQDLAAANQAAWENIQGGLSTSVAEARAVRAGATGEAARLCGIVQSNDSSPLGIHLAAVRLSERRPQDGFAPASCMAALAPFL